MHLDYRLSEKWDEDSTDLSTVTETDLRYYVAPGDVVLQADQTDLSANWGWIPLIDFALALREIAAALAAVEEGSETFEFTESEATLKFERQGQEVAISGSYAPEIFKSGRLYLTTGLPVAGGWTQSSGETTGVREEPSLSKFKLSTDDGTLCRNFGPSATFYSPSKVTIARSSALESRLSHCIISVYVNFDGQLGQELRFNAVTGGFRMSF
jgi:hypothetical protein